MTRLLCLLFIIGLTARLQVSSALAQATQAAQPTIALSFDDGNVHDYPGHPLQQWNAALLESLAKHKLHAFFFVKGVAMNNERGRQILTTWSEAGHRLCNHSYYHSNFASRRMSADSFRTELRMDDSLIRPYKGFKPFFRFPYLKEGSTRERVDSIRAILRSEGYRTGHVSVDASDWYISSELEKRLQLDSTADLKGYRDYYVSHLLNRAAFYDSLSTILFQRKVKHVLLLHHNLAAALFLDSLITAFQRHGWRVCSTDEAYEDSLYTIQSPTLPAGESIIWSLAKHDGRFDSILRYPGEDSDYEEDAMRKAGLLNEGKN